MINHPGEHKPGFVTRIVQPLATAGLLLGLAGLCCIGIIFAILTSSLGVLLLILSVTIGLLNAMWTEYKAKPKE
jgi:predicted lipid-binding transport protein (Tim44 family)